MIEDLTVDADRATAGELRDRFRKHGAVLVRKLIPEEILAGMRRDLRRMICARLASIGQVVQERDAEDLDVLFNRICEADRRLGADVYDHAKELPGYYALISAPALRTAVEAVLDTDSFQMPHDLCLFRIDRPEEEKYTFDWHQDYPYNLLSIPAATAWIPLTDVTEDMGQLRIAPGSHDRICEVRITQPGFKPGDGGGGRALEITGLDHARLEEDAVRIPAKAGDVLIFHCLLLHRSGHNRSRRSRWVANPRYGMLLDPTMVERGWHCVTRKEFFIFQDIHPELTHVAESE